MFSFSLIEYLGGDALGSASDILYTPDGLVRQARLNGQPVICVGVNYRLGSTLDPLKRIFRGGN